MTLLLLLLLLQSLVMGRSISAFQQQRQRRQSPWPKGLVRNQDSIITPVNASMTLSGRKNISIMTEHHSCYHRNHHRTVPPTTLWLRERRSVISQLVILPTTIASSTQAATTPSHKTSSTISISAQSLKNQPFFHNNNKNGQQSYYLHDDDKFLLSPKTLVYRKILGQGRYKTVYLVRSFSPSSREKDDITSTTTTTKTSSSHDWAMAVEKVYDKASLRSAMRGIRIAQQLQDKIMIMMMKEDNNNNNNNAPRKDLSHYYYPFEQVETWWFQSAPLAPFRPEQSIFLSKSSSSLQEEEQTIRTQTLPTKFVGRSYWLVALKPLYDMDLDKFRRTVPRRYHYPSWDANTNKKDPFTHSHSKNQQPSHRSMVVVAGWKLDDTTTAWRFVHEVCYAGKLMHQVGLVHRDIKPANIMLQQGHAVVIDFGFSQFVNADGEMCVDEPGKIRGDPHYMLASEAALYQGCARGDAYAIGKTLYQVIFAAPRQGREHHRRHDDGFRTTLQTSTSSSSSSSSWSFSNGVVNASSFSSSSSSESNSSSSSDSDIPKTTTSQKNKLDQIRHSNMRFRDLIAHDKAFDRSRFRLTLSDKNKIQQVIQGLCREKNPLSLAEAVEILEDDTTDEA
jgi:serine/threonine protein kinase